MRYRKNRCQGIRIGHSGLQTPPPRVHEPDDSPLSSGHDTRGYESHTRASDSKYRYGDIAGCSVVHMTIGLLGILLGGEQAVCVLVVFWVL